MYTNDDFNLMEGSQLPYPNRPTGQPPMMLGTALNAGQFPYPGFIPADPFAPTSPAFQLSQAPQFTVTSPIVPASMLTPTIAEGECVAQPFYGLGSVSTAYLASEPPAPIVPGASQPTGDLREVLEPILLADILLGL